MKIFILDQHQLVIDGLLAILKKKKGYEVVGYATSIDKAIEWLNHNHVDLLITESVFSNEDVRYLIKTLNQNLPNIKILILTGENRINKVQELFKIGIHGFIEKHHETKELLYALKQIENGHQYLGEELRQRIIANFAPLSDTSPDITISDTLASITNRELEIIQLICEGFNSKEISDKLFISFNTVETHRKRIFHKLQIKNSIALMRFALKHDLVD